MLWQVQFPQRSNSELLGPVLVATEHVLLRSTPGWVKAPQPQFTTKPAVLSSRFGYTDALQHPWSNDRKAGPVTHGPFLLVDGLVRPDCAGTLPSAVCRLDQEALPGSPGHGNRTPTRPTEDRTWERVHPPAFSIPPLRGHLHGNGSGRNEPGRKPGRFVQPQRPWIADTRLPGSQ